MKADQREELFDIVDSADQIIRAGVREADLHPNNDITRVVTLFIYDRHGKLNIAQRVASKKVDPLKFEAAAHGRVRSGESYENAMMREVQEELSVNLSNMIEVAHYFISFQTNIGIRQHFKKLFIGFTQEDITHNEKEIHTTISFDSFEALRNHHAENYEAFSGSIALDMKKLSEFYENPKNQALVEQYLLQ